MNFLFFQLPLLASTSGDILEVFLVKHSLVCNQLGRFSFSSKTFRPEEKNRRNLSPTSGQGPGFGQAINEVVSCARDFTIFLFSHSDLLYSEDISKFMANFFKRIVKKRGQKLILGDNFINKNSDDFYVLQL